MKRFNPVFVKIFEDGKVKQISFLEAIKSNGSYPELKEEEGALSLKDIIKESKEQKKGPIVVFPEVWINYIFIHITNLFFFIKYNNLILKIFRIKKGTTTNGKGLLKFLPVFKEFTPKDDITLHVYSIKYAI